MKRRNGMFGPSLAIPMITALVLLIAMALFSDTDRMEADAAEFYELTDLSITTDSGTNILGNGSFVSPMEIINITAKNESVPTDTDDTLVIDLNLTDSEGEVAYNTTFSLIYSGTDDDFWGNLTLAEGMDTNTRTVTGGLMIKVSDGYSIKIKKHNEEEIWAHLVVDTEDH